MGAVVRIRYHREIPCHVDPGDEDRFDVVAMPRVASEGYPGIVMTLGVFLEGGFVFNVFPISAIFCDQGRSLFLGEFEREADTGLQESVVMVRNAEGVKWMVSLTVPHILRR